jgi:hypothetical protein
MKNWLIIAAVLLVGWLLISRKLNRAQAAQHWGARFSRMVVSLAVAGGAVWCAWWVLSTRCNGAC